MPKVLLLYGSKFSILWISVCIMNLVNFGVTMEDNNKENNSKNEYEFVTETIKKKPLNKKRIGMRLLHSILLGILGGAVACVFFVVFEPMLYQKMHPEVLDVVTIPEDELVSTENDIVEEKVEDTDNKLNVENVGSKDETEDNKEIEENENENPEAEIDLEAGKDEDTSKEKKEEEPSENDTPSDDNIKIPDDVKEKLLSGSLITLEDYKGLYREMSEVATVAKRAVTTVRGTSDSVDWFNNSYESGTATTGIIVADNGKELLIIASTDKLNKAKEIDVTFCDGRVYNGTLKKSDSDTGLCVVAVLLDEIEDVTKNSYATANLGNSSIPTIVGTPVLAVGSPLGIKDSMASGIITSNNHVLELTDSSIRYLTTDMYGSTEGSGVIIDLEGNVLGIIFQGGTSVDTKNLIHAYSISDIKSTMEKLLNGQDVAYLGIIGTDVTKQAKDELSVPEGAYVKQVVIDSPAMNSGIQNGDVIVKLGTTDIRSFKSYKDAISKCQPGDTAVVTVKRLGKEGYVEFSYEIYLEAHK